MKLATKPNPGQTELTLNNEEVAARIVRVKEGCEDSVRVLMEFLFPVVAKIVNSRVRCRESKDDVTQEIFIRVFSKIDQYSGAVPFHHWVSRIAVNTCTTAYHRAKSSRELRMADLSEDEERVVENLKTTAGEAAPSDRFAAREIVEKLMASLNAEDELVIRLVYLNGYSHQQVSDLTGWSVSLAKVRAFRARQRLRRTLEKLTAEPQIPVPIPQALQGLISQAA